MIAIWRQELALIEKQEITAIGSAIGQAIIVVGDSYWSNSDQELIVDRDGTEVARFAAGQWRYAQLLDGSEGGL